MEGDHRSDPGGEEEEEGRLRKAGAPPIRAGYDEQADQQGGAMVDGPRFCQI